MTDIKKEELLLHFEEWASDNHIHDNTLNLITWLDMYNMINIETVNKYIKGEI